MHQAVRVNRMSWFDKVIALQQHSNHHCILVDDIVDSGGTLCNAAVALIEAGGLSVDAYVTHGVLSGSAVSKIIN